MTTRDIVVAGALQRHQVVKYLEALGIDWRAWPISMTQDRLVFDATEVQWGQIQEWVKKVTG